MSCDWNYSRSTVRTMSTPNRDRITVGDVMLPPARVPLIGERMLLKEALETMGQFRLGIACIVNDENHLLGIITDGDVRRKLLSVQKPFSAFFVDDALDHAIRKPVTIAPDESLDRAVAIMGDREIWDLPVVDAAGRLVGLLHLHPAVEALLERSRSGGHDEHKDSHT
jgi:DeoR family transcriptional regulator, catabolite repression regulator